MRRRAQAEIRVLGECARCGGNAIAYDVERVDAVLGGVWHRLVVCVPCQVRHADTPTEMEAEALALTAPPSAVEEMAFFQRWHANAARVQRTARHFLGAARCDGIAAELRAAAADRAALQQERDAWWRQRELASGDYDDLRAESIGACTPSNVATEAYYHG